MNLNNFLWDFRKEKDYCSNTALYMINKTKGPRVSTKNFLIESVALTNAFVLRNG